MGQSQLVDSDCYSVGSERSNFKEFTIMDTNQETNRERLPQKQAAQGKIGSEPDAKRQVADGTNEPEKIKKPRKTKAEQLIDLLKKQRSSQAA